MESNPYSQPSTTQNAWYRPPTVTGVNSGSPQPPVQPGDYSAGSSSAPASSGMASSNPFSPISNPDMPSAGGDIGGGAQGGFGNAEGLASNSMSPGATSAFSGTGGTLTQAAVGSIPGAMGFGPATTALANAEFSNSMAQNINGNIFGQNNVSNAGTYGVAPGVIGDTGGGFRGGASPSVDSTGNLSNTAPGGIFGNPFGGTPAASGDPGSGPGIGGPGSSVGSVSADGGNGGIGAVGSSVNAGGMAAGDPGGAPAGDGGGGGGGGGGK